MRRQIALGVQRPETCERLARLGHRSGGRRVQQGQPFHRLRPPARQIEGERGQVRLLNLRPLMRDQTTRLLLVPQAVTDAGLDTPRPAAPLLRRGSADLDGGQASQAAGRLETRYTRQAAVNDDAHPLNRQAGLGHRGRQHHLAATRRGGLDGPVLLALVQRAIQGDHVDRRITQPLFQALDRAVNLPLSRQEGQDRAGLVMQGLNHGLGHGVLESFNRVATQIAGLDREHPPLGLDDGGAAQQLGHARDVERRRHDQQAQIVAQHGLAVARQRQPQISVQTAFVEFVEQDGADAFQPRIVQDHPREDALGHHLDSGVRADPALQTSAVSDGSSRFLAQAGGHAVGGGARGQSSRLQHQNPAVAQPRLIQQRQRHDRRLARARRRGQHDRRGLSQGGLERLQNGVNRQHDTGCSAFGLGHESVVGASSFVNRVAPRPSDG